MTDTLSARAGAGNLDGFVPVSVLEEIFATLKRANTDGSICDTIWHGLAETLFDFIEVAIEKAAAPSKWLKFDYSNPPDEGIYWIHFEGPETDCDVDDYGRTVGWYTGETERTVAMVHLITDGEGAFDFHDVDRWNLGGRPHHGVACHYMPVEVPKCPDFPSPVTAPEA